MTRILLLVSVVVLLLTSCVVVRPATTALLGEARVHGVLLPAGELPVPQARRDQDRYEAHPGDFVPEAGPVRDLVEQWADRDLPSWEEEGKVTAPRIIMAKLALRRDVDAVNAYLQDAEPWAGIGSTWGLRPNGDYDFSLPPLTAILYQYGDQPELLFPETREHLLAELLNQEGGRFITTVPGSLRLVAETENHILMTEGSRYLKNQWLAAHGSSDRHHDNVANGLEDRLVEYIRELDLAGTYEFNSTPYVGYTLMALLTLEAFAQPPVARAARAAIDRINYEYALGSLGLRRYAPYRRQRRRAGITDLTDHPHTAMMRTWAGLAGHPFLIANNEHQAVYAALMPYRLPEQTLTLLRLGPPAAGADARASWYVRIGRGPGASPELYSRGEGYLISAGGTGRPRRSQIVARPITLFLEDDTDDLAELFSLGGSGEHERWNNTGVLPGLAVGRSPLAVPDAYDPVARSGDWEVFALPDGLTIATIDTGITAAIFVLEDSDLLPRDLSPTTTGENAHAAALADWLASASPREVVDGGTLVLPDGRSVGFDLNADRDTWVIATVNGESVDRDLGAWPRLGGWIGSP